MSACLAASSSVSTTLLPSNLDDIDGRMVAIPRTIQTEPNDIYKIIIKLIKTLTTHLQIYQEKRVSLKFQINFNVNMSIQ